MANPPFAGDIRESHIIHQYELGFKGNGVQSKVGRDILFIERNLDFLKPGGRMAIVLPQGRFNNTSDKYIRDFIAEHARILAVVGLHPNTFKPHTGTKTSVLFLQKWNNDPTMRTHIVPEKLRITLSFLLFPRKGGKDNSGNYVYLDEKKCHPIVATCIKLDDETDIAELLTTICIMTMGNYGMGLQKSLLIGWAEEVELLTLLEVNMSTSEKYFADWNAKKKEIDYIATFRFALAFQS